MQGIIYTKRQRQRQDEAWDIALIEIKRNELSLQNLVATHFGGTSLISMISLSKNTPLAFLIIFLIFKI